MERGGDNWGEDQEEAVEVSLCGAHEWRDSGGGGGRRPSTMVKVRVVFPLVPSAEDPFRLAPPLLWQPKIMG